MHHAFLDEYRDIESPLHRLPVKIKLIFLIFYILAVVLTPIHFFWWFIFYAILILAAILLSRLPWGFVFKRLQEISPFILLVLISVPFLYKEQRLLIFSRCLARAVLAGLAMVVVFSTARFTKVLAGLRELKTPEIFIKLLSFMYRYLFVLEDEFEKMQRCFEARRIDKKQGWFHLQSFANMLGVLFIRAFERSERIYLAMCARGLNEQDNRN
jgi:cobalt/nickel transport system permease protein